MVRPLEQIIGEAARLWGVATTDILGPSKHREHANPRYAVAWIAHQGGYSSNRIAAALQRAHHNWVLQGARNFEDRARRDPDQMAKAHRLLEFSLQGQ